MLLSRCYTVLKNIAAFRNTTERFYYCIDYSLFQEHRAKIAAQKKQAIEEENNNIEKTARRSRFSYKDVASGSSAPTAGKQKYSAESSTATSNKSASSDILPPSPDIISGWDFGIRRRSNTAQKLERIRAERAKRVRTKTVHWDQLCEEDVVEDATTSAILTSNARANLLVQRISPTSSTMRSQTGFEIPDVPVLATENLDEPVFGTPPPVASQQSQVSHKTKKKLSSLSRCLLNSTSTKANPFKAYAKYNGKGQEASYPTQEIDMYVHVQGELAVNPVKVVIVKTLFLNTSSAQQSMGGSGMKMMAHADNTKISHLIGLTCWQYTVENRHPPLASINVNDYAIHMTEDDGEVDYGFPALESNEPVKKFSFPCLALIEKRPLNAEDDNEEDDNNYRESAFVVVNDFAGFSLIQVEDLSIKMGEIMQKALIKRRKGVNSPYVFKLEYQQKIGETVDLNQTLESTGTMEFHLLRENSSRKPAEGNENNNRPKDVHTPSLQSKTGYTKTVTSSGFRFKPG